MGSQEWWVVTREECLPLLPGPGDADKPSQTRARSTPVVHSGQQGWYALAYHRKEDGVALAEGEEVHQADAEVFQLDAPFGKLGDALAQVFIEALDDLHNHCVFGWVVVAIAPYLFLDLFLCGLQGRELLALGAHVLQEAGEFRE